MSIKNTIPFALNFQIKIKLKIVKYNLRKILENSSSFFFNEKLQFICICSTKKINL